MYYQGYTNIQHRGIIAIVPQSMRYNEWPWGEFGKKLSSNKMLLLEDDFEPVLLIRIDASEDGLYYNADKDKDEHVFTLENIYDFEFKEFLKGEKALEEKLRKERYTVIGNVPDMGMINVRFDHDMSIGLIKVQSKVMGFYAKSSRKRAKSNKSVSKENYNV